MVTKTAVPSPERTQGRHGEAVSNRQSIESDAERLARNSASYEVIEPGALPTRGASKTVNIVEYALSSDNM